MTRDLELRWQLVNPSLLRKGPLQRCVYMSVTLLFANCDFVRLQFTSPVLSCWVGHWMIMKRDSDPQKFFVRFFW